MNPRANVEGLSAAVAKLGYTVTAVAEGQDRRSPAERYSEEAIYQRRNVLLAALLTVPLMALSMLGTSRSGRGSVLRSLGATMDTLISVGTLAAFGYSVWALFTNDPIFFETSAKDRDADLAWSLLRSPRQGSSQAVTKLLELSAREVRVIRDNSQVMVDPRVR